MMLCKEFVEEIVNGLQELLPETTVNAQEVVKNNDITYNGILIRKNGDSIAPTFYIENYLNVEENIYFTPQNIQRIVKEIFNAYKDVGKSTPTNLDNIGEFIKDFSNVKSLLRMRLINKNNNTKLFETIPYIPFLDMAIIAVIELGGSKQGYASTKVSHGLLQQWGYTSLSDILPIAKENTFKEPHVLQNIVEIMLEMMDIPEEIFEGAFMPFMPMYVLTNKNKLHGATEICNYSTMQDIADKFKSDLYVIPSSIHEVIIVPKEDNNNIDVASLTEMVKEVNGSEVSPEEVLSNHAYVFTRDNGWDF